MYNKPFLEWASGKYRILGKILNELPAGSRFMELSSSSCAVYLNMDFPEAMVCDCNSDLINLYSRIQMEGEDFIRYRASFYTGK